jgi:hypothetical protein
VSIIATLVTASARKSPKLLQFESKRKKPGVYVAFARRREFHAAFTAMAHVAW